MNCIDLRSDTVTWPTPAMRRAMAEATVGDDVYGDDPTVNRLEELAAAATGKEAAMLVPSGTFGNQVALFSWCPRGSEIILGDQCHIIQHEAGAAAAIAGVQTRTIDAPDGFLDPEAVRSRIRTPDIHHPNTSLICVENAHSSGRVLPLTALDAIQAVAAEHRIPTHMDGARLFNAAAALGTSAAEIAARVDSVMFCLSKGLCAPIGSMLAGPRDFIVEARRKRKIMGGAMRQAGTIAAAGILALTEMTERLAEDHRNAKELAARLGELPGVTVDAAATEINMVFFRVAAPVGETDYGRFADRLVRLMAARGVLINPPFGYDFRFVTHYWIDRARVTTAVDAFAAALQEARA